MLKWSIINIKWLYIIIEINILYLIIFNLKIRICLSNFIMIIKLNIQTVSLTNYIFWLQNKIKGIFLSTF